MPSGGGGFTAAEFVTGLGANSAVTMIFGPHNSTQALYYTTYAGGDRYVALPTSALTWAVLLHHIDQANPDTAHTHPILGPTTGTNISFIAPPPEDLAAAALSYLEIQLTATDSSGRATTITQTLQPRRVNLTFATRPQGFNLIVNGNTITTAQTFAATTTFSKKSRGLLMTTSWPLLFLGDCQQE